MIKLGDITAQKMMLGSTPVQKVMLGTEQVWALTPPYLTVTPESQLLPKTAGTFTLQIESNTDWTIHGSNWLTPNVLLGTGSVAIIVNYGSNTSALRTGSIVVLAGDIIKTVSVTQATAIGDIAVDPTFVRVMYRGGAVIVYVTSNYDWRVSSDVFWITKISPALGGLGRTRVTLTIAPNNNGEERSGCLSFVSMESGFAKLEVTQGAMSASGTESMVSAEHEAMPNLDTTINETTTEQ